MSTVYLAVQLSVGREVALKVMSPALNTDPVFSERFQREANIVGQLSHPNIVAIYDIGRHEDLNYIAMDYLPGGSVHDQMIRGISTQEGLRIIQEISNALDHAHKKNYIHRDIKPENILFREDNTSVLSDFGVAKIISNTTRMTNVGTVLGTPHYMSPEQARGTPIDGRSDIYSLGVVFYEILTGSVPYRADEAVAIAIQHLTAPIPTLPSQYSRFQPILNKMLAKDPDDRFQRGREVTAAIHNLHNTLPGSTAHFVSNEDPSAGQILSLLNALLLTSSSALAWQLKALKRCLCSFRWSLSLGLYRQHKASPTIMHANAGSEHGGTTVVSTSPLTGKPAPANSLAQAQKLLDTVSPLQWGVGLSVLSMMVFAFWAALNAIPEPNTPTAQTLGLTPELAAASAVDPLTPAMFGSASASGLSSGTTSDVASIAISTNSAPTEQSAQQNDPERLSKDLAIKEPGSTAKAKPKPKKTTAVAIELPKLKPRKITPPAPPHYPIYVKVSPENATIRILNIGPKYYPGIRLLPGRYHVEVTNKGYDPKTEWVTLSSKRLSLDVNLRKIPVVGAVFYNKLAKYGQGPAMVIVPSGRFNMGDRNSSKSAPVRRVRFTQPFAISQYEITFADFDKYSKATDTKPLKDKRWGRGSRPAINVSWQQAQDYVRWLSKTSGREYRLPSESEWEYIARAKTKTDYWWGNNSAKGQANCRRGCDSEYSSLFITKTAPVGSYKANPFKVYDTTGNVNEWVQDCYQDHYLGAPKNGTAVNGTNCKQRSVRGGSIRSSVGKLAVHRRDKRAPSRGYSDVGFRVAVKLY